MPGKMLGRVGDSPLFGSGAYGDPNGCCSSTGHGESLIKVNICRQVLWLLIVSIFNGLIPRESRL